MEVPARMGVRLPRQAPIAKTINQATRIMTEDELNKLAQKVTAKLAPYHKEILTSAEVADILGMSMSYLYKLTMKCEIPHYKPLGKLCYFRRSEIEAWALNEQYKNLKTRGMGNRQKT